MPYKCITVFCAIMVVGLAIVAVVQHDRKVTAQKEFSQTFLKIASEVIKDRGDDASVRNLLPYAARLAGKNAQVDVAFFQQIVAKAGEAPIRVKLAALILGRTGIKETRDCLLTLLVDKPMIAAQVVSHMSPNNLRGVAKHILATKKEAKLQIAATRWLWHVGDKGSLTMLKKMSEEVADATIRDELQIAIGMVTERLNNTPEGMEHQWIMQEVRYWRAQRDTGPCIVRTGTIIMIADLLAKEEAFSTAYLRYKLRRGDPVAVVLAGRQRETSLVNDIQKIRGHHLDLGLKITSLLMIGNTAAMDAIVKEIKPGATKANKRIADILVYHGGKSSVAILKKLSKDKKYKASWPSFKEVLKDFERRPQAIEPSSDGPKEKAKPDDQKVVYLKDVWKPLGPKYNTVLAGRTWRIMDNRGKVILSRIVQTRDDGYLVIAR